MPAPFFSPATRRAAAPDRGRTCPAARVVAIFCLALLALWIGPVQGQDEPQPVRFSGAPDQGRTDAPAAAQPDQPGLPGQPGQPALPGQPGGTPPSGDGATLADDPGGAAAGKVKPKVRFRLDLSSYNIGSLLPRFGPVAVVLPDRDGKKGIGLNGLAQGEIDFPGQKLRDFALTVLTDYRLPIREGVNIEANLMTVLLGESTQRQLTVNLSQAEAEPPKAVFSLTGPQLAPGMFCYQVPMYWEEGQLTKLTLEKRSGSLRIIYNGKLLCTSPIDDKLTLTGYSVRLGADSVIHDVELLEVPTGYEVVTESLPPTVGEPIEEAEPEKPGPRPEPEPGVTSFDYYARSPGSPSKDYGANMVILRDEEGKYLTPTNAAGANVKLVAPTGPRFSTDILVKNAFPLSESQNTTNRLFLFTLIYKNGVREVYSLTLVQDPNFIWQSSYTISRSGPDIMNWSATTDFRPWDNALNFNDYKVVKNGANLTFFFNGEFIRTEPSKGDALAAVEMPLRHEERLYDIVVRDLAIAGATAGPVAKDATRSTEPAESGPAEAPRPDETPRPGSAPAKGGAP